MLYLPLMADDEPIIFIFISICRRTADGGHVPAVLGGRRGETAPLPANAEESRKGRRADVRFFVFFFLCLCLCSYLFTFLVVCPLGRNKPTA